MHDTVTSPYEIIGQRVTLMFSKSFKALQYDLNTEVKVCVQLSDTDTFALKTVFLELTD